MGLESGTWVEDLVVTNPPSTDDKRQGDDHLRLIKSVLKNTFKRTSGRPVFFPTSVVTSNDYTILDIDENTIFRCDTTAAPFTLTLPNTLTTANAGWKIIVVKTNNTANPVFILPPTGTLDGFTKIRRTAENKRTEIMWTGVGWIVTRPDSAPIGSVHEFYGSALPNGYLWPDGTTFVATDFVELNAILGTNTKPDLRGRGSFGRDDMGGSAASRITGVGLGIVGTTLKAVGGEETHILASGELAAHNHGFTTGTQSADHTHNVNGTTLGQSANHTHSLATNYLGSFNGVNNDLGAGGANGSFRNSTTSGTSVDHSHTFNVNSGGMFEQSYT